MDTTSGWVFDAEPPPTDSGTVTLVEQTSFCVGGPNGNLDPAWPHGLFFHDTRLLARWLITVDGAKVEPLTVMNPEPFAATFVGRARPEPGRPHSTVLVERRRYVGSGMREDVVIRNLAPEPATIQVALAVAADFADLFQVKEGRVKPAEGVTITPGVGELWFEQEHRGGRRGVRVVAKGSDEPVVDDGGMTFTPTIEGRASWTVSLEVHPMVGDTDISPSYPLDRPIADAPAAQRARAWESNSPVVKSADDGLLRTVRTSRRDLGALRIFDPEDPASAAIAAGAPWFMALFGRDSLLTSFLSLSLDPSLALGTLKTLAKYQGVKYDSATEEEPGRILHEVRLGVNAELALGGGNVYYGTADASPLFVMLLGELCRWGLGDDHLDELLPVADRCLEWIQGPANRLGDGFVYYERATEHGLVNQGWMDSWDGVSFADGTLAKAPIALCEVQAYVYAAYVARSHIAREQGDDQAQQHWQAAAEKLREEFNRRFWMPEKGWFAFGLDRDGNQIDALTSNMGHCLWTGLVDPDKARLVADRLMSPEMYTGWGVRTLATTMGRYNPISYNNGSVWPHDNAIIAAGLMRYGFVEEATTVAVGMLEAAEHFDGRLPEFFCGFDRSEFDAPVPFPTSCSPQAWSAAAPIHLLRTLLRLDPSVSQGEVRVDPVLPESMLPFSVENLSIGGARLRIQVDSDGVRVDGMTPGLAIFPVTFT